MNALYKNLVAIMGVAFAVSLLVAACTNSSSDESPSPAVVQEIITSEVPTPEQTSKDDVFLRVIAPLDEERGYCLDIPGHLSGVRLESPLQAHTCKNGIWNRDGQFDVAALSNGTIRMPEYDLCLQAENSSSGARLLLGECTEAELQIWILQDSGEILLNASPQMCVTIADGAGRDAGGPQYLMKSVGLDTCTQQASDRQRWTTAIPR